MVAEKLAVLGSTGLKVGSMISGPVGEGGAEIVSMTSGGTNTLPPRIELNTSRDSSTSTCRAGRITRTIRRSPPRGNSGRSVAAAAARRPDRSDQNQKWLHRDRPIKASPEPPVMGLQPVAFPL